MASAPAYRYDAAPAPARQFEPSPSIRVVPGRKHSANPVLSDGWVTVCKVLIACILAFLVIGFARVCLASAAYSTASAASEMRSDISDARSTSQSLAVQRSLVASPSNLRAQAQDKLKMVAPSASETITLSVDPVATDANGNLSFSRSVARLTSQG